MGASGGPRVELAEGGEGQSDGERETCRLEPVSAFLAQEEPLSESHPRTYGRRFLLRTPLSS